MGKFAQHFHLDVRGLISVNLERNVLLPGETLTGALSLRINKRVEAAKLFVRVKGVQCLRWETGSGDDTSTYRNENVILSLEHTFANDPTVFTEGQTYYPFSFQLPEDLEDSFVYRNRGFAFYNNVQLDVTYTIEASLVVDAFTTANLVATTPFTITSFPRAVPVPQAISETRTGDVKFLAMFASGSCTISMDIATNTFNSASTIEATVAIASKTTRRLKHVNLVLYEDATISPDTNIPRSHSRIVSCRRFEASTLGPVASGAGGKPICLRLPITPSDLYKFDPLPPTQDRHFLKLGYHVAVECHFSKSRRVRVEAPVTIVSLPN